MIQKPSNYLFSRIWLLNVSMNPFLTCTVGGGVDKTLPTRVSKLRVAELSRKKQWIALDDYSRLVVRFFVLVDPVLGIKGQIFAKSAIFQLCSSIFQKL